VNTKTPTLSYKSLLKLTQNPYGSCYKEGEAWTHPAIAIITGMYRMGACSKEEANE